jgi:hypothetical protein
MMMPPTHLWHFPDQSNLWPLDRPWHRTVHLQRPVRTPMIILLDVGDQEPPEMSRVRGEHVVQVFPTDAPDEPLHVRILPRTPGGDEDLLDPHMADPLPNVRA